MSLNELRRRLLTFEFLVFRVIEVSNLVGGGTIRVVPDIVINGAETIQSILDFNRYTVISYLISTLQLLVLIVHVCCSFIYRCILKHLAG